MKRNKNLIKGISVFVSIAFLCQDASWAIPNKSCLAKDSLASSANAVELVSTLERVQGLSHEEFEQGIETGAIQLSQDEISRIAGERIKQICAEAGIDLTGKSLADAVNEFKSKHHASSLISYLEKFLSLAAPTTNYQQPTTESLWNGIEEYTQLKDRLIIAVMKDEREEALKIYGEWVEKPKMLSIENVSLDKLAAMVANNIKCTVAPVMGDILGALQFTGTEANTRGVVIERALMRAGIESPSLARLIYDTIVQIPAGTKITVDVLNACFSIAAESIAREVKILSEGKFPPFMRELIGNVVEEVVTALYDDKAQRDAWRTQMLADIVPYTIRNFIPARYFEAGVFEEKKDWILASLIGLNLTVANAYGSYSPELKKLFLNANPNEIEMRSTIKHELTHYLADRGQIKIDASWEFTTNAVAISDMILHSHGDDIEAAEGDMSLYTEKYGYGFSELYGRGKEIAASGQSAYILEPHKVDSTAGYFSIDLLIIEAIKVFQAQGIRTDQLKRFLSSRRTMPRTPYEIEQFMRDQYEAQRVAGIIMSGIFVGEYQKTGVQPIKAMRDYFDKLDKIFSSPTADEVQSIERMIKNLARTMFGISSVEFKPAESTDEMGLWRFKKINDFSAEVGYWPFTLKTNRMTDPDGKETERRAIGQVLIAYYRHFFIEAQSSEVESSNKELFSEEAFRKLWSFATIPAAIVKGIDSMRGKAANTSNLPYDIKLVFDNLFNLGNADVERQLFQSYPLHLQYINSLLYRWSQTPAGAKRLIEDPRVEKGGLVDAVIGKTLGAWFKLSVLTRENSDLEQILAILENEIWPEYKKLFEEDMRRERDRKLIEKLEKENKVDAGQFDPNNLTPEQQQILENYFNSLPQEMKDAIMDAVEEMMEQAGMGQMGQGQGQAGNQGQQGNQGRSGNQGQSGQGKVGRRTSDVGRGVESVEQALQELDALNKELENLVSQMSEQAGKIGKSAGEIGSSAGGENTQGKGQEILDQARELQDEAAKLKSLSDRLNDGANETDEKANDASDNLPVPSMGKKMRERTADLSSQTDEQRKIADELMKKANKLVRQAKELKDMLESGNPTSAGQQGRNVGQTSADIQDKVDELSSSLDEVRGAIKNVREGIEGLAGAIGKEQRADSSSEALAKEEGEGHPPKTGETGRAEGKGQSAENIGDKLKQADKKDGADLSKSSGTKESGPGSDSGSVGTELEMPDNAATLDNVVKENGKARTTPARQTKRRDGGRQYHVPSRTDAELAAEVLQEELLKTGLTEKEYGIYKAWKERLQREACIDIEEEKNKYRDLLKNRLGVRFAADMDRDEMVEPLAIRRGEPGYEYMARQKPVPVFMQFVVDKSGSMDGERMDWARLTLLLMLEVIFEINDEYSKGEPLIKFEIIVYDGKTHPPILNHRTSEELNITKRPKIIYEALSALTAGGSTEEKQALIEATSRVKYATSDVDKMYRVVVNIQDGNFGDPSIKDLIQKASDEDNICVFVASVGDSSANENVISAVGEDNAIIPKTLGEMPGLISKKVLGKLEELYGKGEDADAYFNEKKPTEIDSEIRDIFEGNKTDCFSFLPGWHAANGSKDKGMGRLFEELGADGEFYKGLLLKILNGLKNKYPKFSEYDIVALSGVNFSGHYGTSRYRIYIPLSILEIAKQNPAMTEKIIADFILHHYLENLFKRQNRGLSFSEQETEIIKAINDISGGEELSLHDKIVLYTKNIDRDAGRIGQDGMSVYEQAQKLYRERLRSTGYRHFFYQTRGEKEYLIYRKTLKSGKTVEYKWERGAGKLYVPDTVTVDNDHNERIILEIFKSFYEQGKDGQAVEYTSYSHDGRYLIRKWPDERVTLEYKNKDAKWDSAVSIDLASIVTDGLEKRIENGVLSIKAGGEYKRILSSEKFSDNVKVSFSTALSGYLIYDETSGRALVAKSRGKELVVDCDLSVEEYDSEYARDILEIEGEPGLGKDELIRAAAHLMNEDVYYVTGHKKASIQDFKFRQMMFRGRTEYVYSGLNNAQHYGGWCVITEARSTPTAVTAALKKDIASFTHERPMKNPGTGKYEMVSDIPNHPRFRALITDNILRKGIVAEAEEDQANEDRKSGIHVVWPMPNDEKGLLVELTMQRVMERKDISVEEADELREKLHSIANVLVESSKNLRFTFMGYNAKQRARLNGCKTAREWYGLLRSWEFKASEGDKAGAGLRRAPSTRVLANIMQFIAEYPKTWEHQPWSVIEMFFNFNANKATEEQRKEWMKTVQDQFKVLGFGEGDKKHIVDESNLPPVILTADSFVIEGEYLVVKPKQVEKDGKLVDFWDTVRVWVPESARRNIPWEIEFWVSTGSVKNNLLLYRMLQAAALGKNILSIGDAGTGKSFLSEAVAKLLGGPKVESIQMTKATTMRDFAWKPILGVEGDSDFEEGPVLKAFRANKPFVGDELTSADPTALTGLNEPVERKRIEMPDGTPVYGRNTIFLFTANTPGGPFDVEEPKDEFNERCIVLKFDPISPEEMFEYLRNMKGKNEMSVNPRILGEPKILAGGAAETIAVGDRVETRWTGIVGITQWMRAEALKNASRKTIPRVPGFRTWIKLTREIASSWEEEDLYEEGETSQEQFWKKFRKRFVMGGKTESERGQREKFCREALKASGLWRDSGDAVADYLAGEDMRIIKMPVLRNPKTGDKDTDKILTYIQENTRGAGLTRKLNELRAKANEIASKTDEWNKMEFSTRLKRLYELREIWQILKILRDNRGKGSKLKNYPQADYELMRTIMTDIQGRILEEEWPETFLKDKAGIDDTRDYKTAWEELEAKWGKLVATGDLVVDDLLGKIAVCRENEDYVRQQAEKLKAHIKARWEVFRAKDIETQIEEHTHEIFITGSSINNIKKISGYSSNPLLKALSANLLAIQLETRKAILEKLLADMHGKLLHEIVLQLVLLDIVGTEDDIKRSPLPVDDRKVVTDGAAQPWERYVSLVSEAVGARRDFVKDKAKQVRNEKIKAAEKVYSEWQKEMKENHRTGQIVIPEGAPAGLRELIEKVGRGTRDVGCGTLDVGRGATDVKLKWQGVTKRIVGRQSRIISAMQDRSWTNSYIVYDYTGPEQKITIKFADDNEITVIPHVSEVVILKNRTSSQIMGYSGPAIVSIGMNADKSKYVVVMPDKVFEEFKSKNGDVVKSDNVEVISETQCNERLNSDPEFCEMFSWLDGGVEETIEVQSATQHDSLAVAVGKIARDINGDIYVASGHIRKLIAIRGGDQKEEIGDFGDANICGCSIVDNYLFVATNKGLYVYDKNTKESAGNFGNNGVIGEGEAFSDVAVRKVDNSYEIFAIKENKVHKLSGNNNYTDPVKVKDIGTAFCIRFNNENDELLVGGEYVFAVNPDTLAVNDAYKEKSTYVSVIDTGIGKIIALTQGGRIVVLEKTKEEGKLPIRFSHIKTKLFKKVDEKRISNLYEVRSAVIRDGTLTLLGRKENDGATLWQVPVMERRARSKMQDVRSKTSEESVVLPDGYSLAETFVGHGRHIVVLTKLIKGQKYFGYFELRDGKLEQLLANCGENGWFPVFTNLFDDYVAITGEGPYFLIRTKKPGTDEYGLWSVCGINGESLCAYDKIPGGLQKAGDRCFFVVEKDGNRAVFNVEDADKPVGQWCDNVQNGCKVMEHNGRVYFIAKDNEGEFLVAEDSAGNFKQFGGKYKKIDPKTIAFFSEGPRFAAQMTNAGNWEVISRQEDAVTRNVAIGPSQYRLNADKIVSGIYNDGHNRNIFVYKKGNQYFMYDGSHSVEIIFDDLHNGNVVCEVEKVYRAGDELFLIVKYGGFKAVFDQKGERLFKDEVGSLAQRGGIFNGLYSDVVVSIGDDGTVCFGLSLKHEDICKYKAYTFKQGRLQPGGNIMVKGANVLVSDMGGKLFCVKINKTEGREQECVVIDPDGKEIEGVKSQYPPKILKDGDSVAISFYTQKHVKVRKGGVILTEIQTTYHVRRIRTGDSEQGTENRLKTNNQQPAERKAELLRRLEELKGQIVGSGTSDVARQKEGELQTLALTEDADGAEKISVVHNWEEFAKENYEHDKIPHGDGGCKQIGVTKDSLSLINDCLNGVCLWIKVKFDNSLEVSIRKNENSNSTAENIAIPRYKFLQEGFPVVAGVKEMNVKREAELWFVVKDSFFDALKDNRDFMDASNDDEKYPKWHIMSESEFNKRLNTDAEFRKKMEECGLRTVNNKQPTAAFTEGTEGTEKEIKDIARRLGSIFGDLIGNTCDLSVDKIKRMALKNSIPEDVVWDILRYFGYQENPVSKRNYSPPFDVMTRLLTFNRYLNGIVQNVHDGIAHINTTLAGTEDLKKLLKWLTLYENGEPLPRVGVWHNWDEYLRDVNRNNEKGIEKVDAQYNSLVVQKFVPQTAETVAKVLSLRISERGGMAMIQFSGQSSIETSFSIANEGFPVVAAAKSVDKKKYVFVVKDSFYEELKKNPDFKDFIESTNPELQWRIISESECNYCLTADEEFRKMMEQWRLQTTLYEGGEKPANNELPSLPAGCTIEETYPTRDGFVMKVKKGNEYSIFDSNGRCIFGDKNIDGDVDWFEEIEVFNLDGDLYYKCEGVSMSFVTASIPGKCYLIFGPDCDLATSLEGEKFRRISAPVKLPDGKVYFSVTNLNGKSAVLKFGKPEDGLVANNDGWHDEIIGDIKVTEDGKLVYAVNDGGVLGIVLEGHSEVIHLQGISSITEIAVGDTKIFAVVNVSNSPDRIIYEIDLKNPTQLKPHDKYKTCKKDNLTVVGDELYFKTSEDRTPQVHKEWIEKLDGARTGIGVVGPDVQRTEGYFDEIGKPVVIGGQLYFKARIGTKWAVIGPNGIVGQNLNGTGWFDEIGDLVDEEGVLTFECKDEKGEYTYRQRTNEDKETRHSGSSTDSKGQCEKTLEDLLKLLEGQEEFLTDPDVSAKILEILELLGIGHGGEELGDDLLRAMWVLLTINQLQTTNNPRYIEPFLQLLEYTDSMLFAKARLKEILEKIRDFQADAGIKQRVQAIIDRIPKVISVAMAPAEKGRRQQAIGIVEGERAKMLDVGEGASARAFLPGDVLVCEKLAQEKGLEYSPRGMMIDPYTRDVYVFAGPTGIAVIPAKKGEPVRYIAKGIHQDTTRCFVTRTHVYVSVIKGVFVLNKETGEIDTSIGDNGVIAKDQGVPEGIIVDEQGNVYLACTDGIYKYSSSDYQTPVQEIKIRCPGDLKFTGDGKIMVQYCSAWDGVHGECQVCILNRDTLEPECDTGYLGFSAEHATISEDGLIYVTESLENKIRVYRITDEMIDVRYSDGVKKVKKIVSVGKLTTPHIKKPTALDIHNGRMVVVCRGRGDQKPYYYASVWEVKRVEDRKVEETIKKVRDEKERFNITGEYYLIRREHSDELEVWDFKRNCKSNSGITLAPNRNNEKYWFVSESVFVVVQYASDGRKFINTYRIDETSDVRVEMKFSVSIPEEEELFEVAPDGYSIVSVDRTNGKQIVRWQGGEKEFILRDRILPVKGCGLWVITPDHMTLYALDANEHDPRELNTLTINKENDAGITRRVRIQDNFFVVIEEDLEGVKKVKSYQGILDSDRDEGNGSYDNYTGSDVFYMISGNEPPVEVKFIGGTSAVDTVDSRGLYQVIVRGVGRMIVRMEASPNRQFVFAHTDDGKVFVFKRNGDVFEEVADFSQPCEPGSFYVEEAGSKKQEAGEKLNLSTNESLCFSPNGDFCLTRHADKVVVSSDKGDVLSGSIMFASTTQSSKIWFLNDDTFVVVQNTSSGTTMIRTYHISQEGAIYRANLILNKEFGNSRYKLIDIAPDGKTIVVESNRERSIWNETGDVFDDDTGKRIYPLEDEKFLLMSSSSIELRTVGNSVCHEKIVFSGQADFYVRIQDDLLVVYEGYLNNRVTYYDINTLIQKGLAITGYQGGRLIYAIRENEPPVEVRFNNVSGIETYLHGIIRVNLQNRGQYVITYMKASYDKQYVFAYTDGGEVFVFKRNGDYFEEVADFSQPCEPGSFWIEQRTENREQGTVEKKVHVFGAEMERQDAEEMLEALRVMLEDRGEEQGSNKKKDVRSKRQEAIEKLQQFGVGGKLDEVKENSDFIFVRGEILKYQSDPKINEELKKILLTKAEIEEEERKNRISEESVDFTEGTVICETGEGQYVFKKDGTKRVVKYIPKSGDSVSLMILAPRATKIRVVKKGDRITKIIVNVKDKYDLIYDIEKKELSTNFFTQRDFSELLASRPVGDGTGVLFEYKYRPDYNRFKKFRSDVRSGGQFVKEVMTDRNTKMKIVYGTSVEDPIEIHYFKDGKEWVWNLVDDSTKPCKEADPSAYFGEEANEEINPKIKDVLENHPENYRFLKGVSEEGNAGSLDVGQYEQAIMGAFNAVIAENAANNLYDDLKDFQIVVIKGAGFSGHFGRTRKRIYIPMEMLESFSSSDPQLFSSFLTDIIEHEYLHTKDMTEEHIVALSEEKYPGVREKARELYRKYIAEKLVESLKDERIQGSTEVEKLKTKMEKMLKRVQEGQRVELTETQMHRFLWLIDRSKGLCLAPEIAALLDLILDENCTGNVGEVVMAVEKEMLEAVGRGTRGVEREEIRTKINEIVKREEVDRKRRERVMAGKPSDVCL